MPETVEVEPTFVQVVPALAAACAVVGKLTRASEIITAVIKRCLICAVLIHTGSFNSQAVKMRY